VEYGREAFIKRADLELIRQVQQELRQLSVPVWDDRAWVANRAQAVQLATDVVQNDRHGTMFERNLIRQWVDVIYVLNGRDVSVWTADEWWQALPLVFTEIRLTKQRVNGLKRFLGNLFDTVKGHFGGLPGVREADLVETFLLRLQDIALEDKEMPKHPKHQLATEYSSKELKALAADLLTAWQSRPSWYQARIYGEEEAERWVTLLVSEMYNQHVQLPGAWGAAELKDILIRYLPEQYLPINKRLLDLVPFTQLLVSEFKSELVLGYEDTENLLDQAMVDVITVNTKFVGWWHEKELPILTRTGYVDTDMSNLMRVQKLLDSNHPDLVNAFELAFGQNMRNVAASLASGVAPWEQFLRTLKSSSQAVVARQALFANHVLSLLNRQEDVDRQSFVDVINNQIEEPVIKLVDGTVMFTDWQVIERLTSLAFRETASPYQRAMPNNLGSYRTEEYWEEDRQLFLADASRAAGIRVASFSIYDVAFERMARRSIDVFNRAPNKLTAAVVVDLLTTALQDINEPREQVAMTALFMDYIEWKTRRLNFTSELGPRLGKAVNYVRVQVLNRLFKQLWYDAAFADGEIKAK
jgi:hypothetical protein